MKRPARIIAISAVAATVLACSQEGPANAAAGGGTGLVSVDLVLTNGRVLTVNEGFDVHTTVVVDDGRIVATGDESLTRTYQGAEVVDLDGKALMPGFIDSHIHIRGNPRRFIDLGGVDSIAAMQGLLREKVSALGPGEWITGYGWSEDEMAEGRKPLRGDLDLAAPDNPVMFTRAGGHSAVANTLALRLAEITDDTPDPEGGVIERDADGVATGTIRERQGIVGRLVPESTYEELIESLEQNLTALLAKGITSIVDASKRPSDYAMWEELYARPGVRLPRAALQFRWRDPEAIAALKSRVGDGNEFLKIGPIKVFVDGGFTGPAAYTLEPYVNQGDYRGHLNMPEGELVALINEVHDAGWQMGIHAIGDAAIVLVVDTLAETLIRNPRPDHRHYLNLFSMRPPDASMEKMARHGIHITQQPNLTYTLEGRYAANLDGWRLEHNNPLRSPMQHGIKLAISSDVLPIGPLVGLYAAVSRKGMSGRVYGADEAVTMAEAIRAYTLTGAFLSFEEDLKGSLEPGKFADMIVLSHDLLTVAQEEITSVEVEKTYIGGRLVFEL